MPGGPGGELAVPNGADGGPTARRWARVDIPRHRRFRAQAVALRERLVAFRTERLRLVPPTQAKAELARLREDLAALRTEFEELRRQRPDR
jgi:hypothetical protein